jgi:hypothetical protein
VEGADQARSRQAQRHERGRHAGDRVQDQAAGIADRDHPAEQGRGRGHAERHRQGPGAADEPRPADGALHHPQLRGRRGPAVHEEGRADAQIRAAVPDQGGRAIPPGRSVEMARGLGGSGGGGPWLGVEGRPDHGPAVAGPDPGDAQAIRLADRQRRQSLQQRDRPGARLSAWPRTTCSPSRPRTSRATRFRSSSRPTPRCRR